MSTTIEQDRAEKARSIRENLRRHSEIIFAYLHGSFIHSDHYRDVDVAVYLEPSFLASTDIFDYELEKGTALSLDLHQAVDVRVLNNKSPAFQYYATAGELLFCRDDDARVEAIVKVRAVYFDFQLASRRYFEGML